jgi:hypothetical protein
MLPYANPNENLSNYRIFTLNSRGHLRFDSPVIADGVFYYINSNPSPTGTVTAYSIMAVDIHGEDEHKGDMAFIYGEYGRKTRELFSTDSIPYYMKISSIGDGYLYYRLTPNWTAEGGVLEGLHKVRLDGAEGPVKVE